MGKTVGKVARGLTKVVQKVHHRPYLSTYIKAGRAMPAPPLGPQLGQRNLQIGPFCKDFNERTKDIKEGIPLPTKIYINPDRTYNLIIHNPPTSWFLLKAAGIKKGASDPANEVAGKITLKHVYEIAMLKKQDPVNRHTDLKEMCEKVIKCAHTCGIEVTKSLDAEEYGAFLEERVRVVEQQEKEMSDRKMARMHRVA